MNDSQLVQGLRRREPAAMQWLCDCHLPSLWRFVYTRVGGDTHLAEDITSDTVLAMLTLLQSNDCDEERHAARADIQNLAGWLRTVAQRRVSDHFRAASRVQHLIQQATGGSERSEADPAARQELEESRAAVRQAMDGLCDQHRLALEWKYLDKLSVREMALRWEISEKAVESVLFRARREFRERMEKPRPTLPSPLGNLSSEQSVQDEPAEDDSADGDSSDSNSADSEPASDEAAHEMSRE